VIALDASVTLAWFFDDQATEGTDALLQRVLGGEETVVPPNWAGEVTSVLLRAERRGLVDPRAVNRFLGTLGRYGIPSHISSTVAAAELATLARAAGISGYDAQYVLAAQEHGASLATIDGPLQQAARKISLSLELA
jgi:predicted nucleic acid-binding protein